MEDNNILSVKTNQKKSICKILRGVTWMNLPIYNDNECILAAEELGYVFFDTVIPWTSDSLLSCSEQYRMIQLQKENQGKSVEIPYSPGISICGCSLYNVSANQVLLELLQNNGGNL